MGIFEAVMLFCFGASWPLAIYKTVKTKNPIGKSLPFLYLVFIGYASGICHKLFTPHAFNWVIYLYIMNLLLVGTDIVLTKYYIHKNKKL